MPKAIQISRQSTVWIPHLQSYKLVVEALNPQNMPQEVFIKQRLRNFAQDSFDDNFVAVCTPVQLEDLPINSPDAGGSFYRVSKIELVGRLPEAIDKIFDSLIYEVQKLVDDLNALDYLKSAQVYDITAGSTELIPGPTPDPEPITSNKIRIGSDGYLESLVVNEWRPAAVTVYVNNFESLPGAGNINLLYIAKDTNAIYRWNTDTNEYAEVSPGDGAGSTLTSTDELPEGEDNLYFTDLRAKNSASEIIFNAAVPWTANHTLADGTRYLAGDLVYSGGKVYRAKFDNESMPVTNTTYWEDLGAGYRLNIDGRDIPNIPIPTNFATLVDGRVPPEQLPSYVDDVLEYADLASFPEEGEQGKIYVDLDSDKIYRWSGSTYIEIVPSPGTTDSLAEGTTNLYFTKNRVKEVVLPTKKYIPTTLFTSGFEPTISNGQFAGAANTILARTCVLVPIAINQNVSVSSVILRSSTTPLVGLDIDVSIYNTGADDLRIGTQVASGVVANFVGDLAANTNQTINFSQTITLPMGYYWVAILNKLGTSITLASADGTNANELIYKFIGTGVGATSAILAMNTVRSLTDVTLPQNWNSHTYRFDTTTPSTTTFRGRTACPIFYLPYVSL